jgi:hypothetical protein
LCEDDFQCPSLSALCPAPQAKHVESLLLRPPKMLVDFDNILIPQSKIKGYSGQVCRLMSNSFPDVSQEGITEGLVCGKKERKNLSSCTYAFSSLV